MGSGVWIEVIMNVGGDTYSTDMGFGELQPIFLSGSGVSFSDTVQEHTTHRSTHCTLSE